MMIVKNMPMPAPKKKIGVKGTSKYLRILESFQEGDCLLCEDKIEARNISQAALRHKVKVKVRTLENGKIGIWRVAA